MKNKLKTSRYFLLVEMVMAMALMMILTTGFIAGMTTLRKMDRNISSDQVGLLVIDNTVERLSMKSHYDAAEINRVFMDEYQRSGLTELDLIQPLARLNAQDARLSMLRRNGTTLIEVTIKCRR